MNDTKDINDQFNYACNVLGDLFAKACEAKPGRNKKQDFGWFVKKAESQIRQRARAKMARSKRA